MLDIQRTKGIVKIKAILNSSFYELSRAVVSRIPYRPIALEHLYTAQLDCTPVFLPRDNEGINVRQAETRDVDAICQCCNKRTIFEKRFAKGDICLVAVHEKNIIGYEWFSIKSSHTEERGFFVLTIPKNAVYAYDAYVKPGYRGKKVFTFIMNAAVNLTHNMKREKLITRVEKGNNASLIAHKRLGFSIIDSNIFIKIYGKSVFLKCKQPIKWPINKMMDSV